MALASPRCRTAVAASPVPVAGDPERAWLARVAGLRTGRRWWLDSAQAGPLLGRWSFAGAEPYAWLEGTGNRGVLEVTRAVRPDLPAAGRHAFEGPSLDALTARMPPAPEGPSPFPFSGGALLLLGYEWSRQLDRLRMTTPRGEVPDLTAVFVDALWVFDHLEGRIWAVGCGFGETLSEANDAANRAALRLAASPDGTWREPPALPGPAGAMLETVDEGDYGKAIAEVKDRIVAGDVYQACLTRRRVHELRGDPWALYQRLRRRNPAPFGVFLESPARTVIGSSPERFLRVDGEGWVESRPIKGTRPRGRTPEEDRARRQELARSEKDRAENLMIVDLVRNDLGRVCDIGSVHVPELMAIEAYATVFQMVSTVRGRLGPGRHALDAVASAFPPGSMTGAPKLAAMELLDRLEPHPRGLYAGAIGYLDVSGGCDLSVVIRTGFASEGRLAFHTGGGIVADSEIAEEWQESEDKLGVLLEALL